MNAKRASRRAALGFKAHTGWAAMVAIAEGSPQPQVVARERIALAPTDDDAARFVYHAAEGLPVPRAAKLIDQAERTAVRLASDAIEAAVATLSAQGYSVVGCGLIAGNKPFQQSLEAILQSHPLIHTAEGELYRKVIIAGSEACRLPVSTVPARELWAGAQRVIGCREADLAKAIDSVGKAAGRPWGADQKEAMLVAWVALAGANRRS